MNSRPIIPLIVLATLAGACGSSTEQGTTTEPSNTEPATTEPVSTEPVATEPEPDAAVEFESEPIQAGPLFGGGAAQAEDAESASQAEPCNDCEPGDNTGVPVDEPNFEVAAEDEPFCTLLADFEERPFPSDEDEAIVVARAWISDLREVAVETIVGDLDRFVAVLDTAINSQGQIGLDSIGDELDDASDRIDDYVEAQCFGRDVGQVTTAVTTTGEEPPSAIAPETIGGVDIPVIEFQSDARSGTTPFFGESDTGSAGSQAPEADAFCRAVHVINNRPQPSDDIEEISVGQAYFTSIEVLVPAELEDDFEAIKAWTDSVLAAGGLDDFDEPVDGDPVLVAVDAIDDYLEVTCEPV